MMGDRLEGKVIVVTGASGIAAAGARRFASEGADVFIISRTAAACQKLAESIAELSGSVDWAVGDLTDEQAAVDAFASCIKRFSRIDGLFAVAGGSGRGYGDGPIDEVPLEGWEATLELNGHPAFLASRETVRAMLRDDQGGSIVLITSVLARSPAPDLFATHAYAAIKGAEISLVASMASYYADRGIRINAIAPGLVDTPMAQRAADDPKILAYAARKQPLVGGFLDAADIAAAGVFLLSDEARAITGETIAVDGGWSVTEVSR